MAATRADLMAFLDKLGIETNTVDHEPVFTVEESRDLKKAIPGGHTKNLFVKDKKGTLFLVVVLADAIVDMKGLHKKLDCGRLSFGKPDLLEEKLGVTPGSVTPFSIMNDKDQSVTIVLDEAMLTYEILNYHPLKNDATTAIKKDDLISFIRATDHEPLILAISEPAE
ncbi:prolyl-tRNA synthetase associated domain-containing protein [Coralliovum pocilloporae]|uniref:prolyl-tRNA synthetase associated domain-containing protein n=1 Tax=Coralliovum pocilloporae TaxID=3066369 RepID=UPI00330710A8